MRRPTSTPPRGGRARKPPKPLPRETDEKTRKIVEALFDLYVLHHVKGLLGDDSLLTDEASALLVKLLQLMDDWL